MLIHQPMGAHAIHVVIESLSSFSFLRQDLSLPSLLSLLSFLPLSPLLPSSLSPPPTRLSSPGSPGIHYVDQAGVKLRALVASAS